MTPNELLAALLENLSLIPALAFLYAWACVLILVDLFIPGRRKGITAFLAALGLVIALGLTLTQTGDPVPAFGGMLLVDNFGRFLSVLLLGSGLVGIAIAYDYLKRLGLERGEYYVLLLFAVAGMMLMGMAADLITLFLALELLSIPLYVLAGIAVPRVESEEASMKYFILGAFASGIFVYGIALVFGATGTTNLMEIFEAATASSYLLLAGAAMILIGMGFKIAAVPFHMWTPDVYQGAPSSVTAFMAVGAKVAGFAALLRIFVMALPELAVNLTPVLWTLAALTMIVGNLVAIAQTNIKRLLAYSSIAQAGYILMALVPYGEYAEPASSAALFYLVAYAFTSFAAWSVVIALERIEGKGLQLDDYAGLGRRYPALALVMTVAMLSFTGVPPTLGFVGKFYLFSVVIRGGYVGLALIGVLTSLISAYYYLRVVVIMYMREGEPLVRYEPWLYTTAAFATIGTVVLSLYAQPLLQWAAQAVAPLF